jgi:hypothetical protein
MPELKKNIIAPTSALIWTYIFEPDNNSKFADGKYKQSARYFGEEATKMKEILDELASKAAKELGVDSIDQKLYKPAKDKDKKEIPGAIEVKFKSKTAPIVIDGKKNRLTQSQIPGYKENCMLGTGHVVFQASAMEVSGKNYLPLYLQAVQITDLSTGGVDMDMFSEVDDGFVADTSAVNNNEGASDDIPDFAAK